jgi:predicted TPR repeat methyltransferase
MRDAGQAWPCVKLTRMKDTLELARQAFLNGVEQFEQGQLEAAALAFEQALSHAPGRPSVLMNLGVTRVHLGQFAQAEPLLRQALAADDSLLDAWKAWGMAQMALGDWAGALASHQRARALGADDAPFCLRWGQCLAHQHQLSEALQAFDAALSHDDSLAEAWTQKGHLHREVGATDLAVQSYRNALDRGADAPLHHYYLAALNPDQPVVNAPSAYVEQLFDQYADDFDTHLVQQLGYQGHRVLLDQLPCEPDHRFEQVWDLGCGTGLCGGLVRSRSRHLTGVDLSAAMVEKSRALGVYDELHATDLLGFLASPGPQADLVLAADVFIYVGRLDEVFACLSPRVRSQGLLAFTIEESDAGKDVQLHPSLRFSHALGYIDQLAQGHGWRQVHLHRAPLRLDEGRPLMGCYVYLQKI